MILLLVSPRQRGCDLPRVLGALAEECLVVTTASQRDAWPGARETAVVARYDTDDLVAAALWLSRRYPIDRVISFAEADVLAAAVLRELFDAPGQDVASAEAYRDKATMRACMDEHAPGGPRWAVVEGPDDVRRFVRGSGWPVVLKPRRASGSVGVQVLAHPHQLEDLPEHLPWHMVEEFVEGETVHVDGLVLDGEPVLALPAAYTDLGCLAHLQDRGNGSYLLPSTDPRHAPLVDALWDVVRALPPAQDLVLHAEFFLREDHPPVLCEIASRLPGHPIPPMLDRALGLSVRDLWLRHQAGEAVDRDELRRRAGRAHLVANYGLPPRRGLLRHVPTRAPASCAGWVHDVLALASPGAVWDEQRYTARKSGDFVVTWTVTAPEVALLRERVEESARLFEAEVVFSGAPA